MHGGDAGVLQLSGDACLAEEALGKDRIGRVTIGQQLDGDIALKGDIAGAIDDAHAALPDLVDQLVAGERRPRRRCLTKQLRRRWLAWNRLRRVSCRGRLRERDMEFELMAQLLGALGRSAQIFVGRRCLATFLSDQEFAVDQQQRRGGVGGDARVTGEVVLSRDALAGVPALPLVGCQHLGHL